MVQISQPATYDLDSFSLKEMTQLGAALRQMGRDAICMEDVAQRTVSHLYDSLVSKSLGDKACVLVRFFKTHPYKALERDLQECVIETLGSEPPSQTKCLTLLATAGSHGAWNDRRYSLHHRSIPLISEETVQRMPMIAQLVLQFGLEIPSILCPDGQLLLELEQRAYNVFYVGQAQGNPSIPAQEDFVIPHSVKSVLGFGGMLPSSDMFAVIIFARVSISRKTALSFKPFALNTKLAILPFDGAAVFKTGRA